MRLQGKLSEWNDARGFGFVQPNGGGERCFVHIHAFTDPDRRPLLGDVITYDVQRDAQGRNTAVGVRFARQRGWARAGSRATQRDASGADILPRTTIALLFLAGIGIAALLGRVPVLIGAIYVGLSGVTYWVYALDKVSAQRGLGRTSEKTLHMLEVFGGWPGALIAQARLRHKNRKVSFQVTFWIGVVLNLAALWWVFANPR
ncbi:DUF1294 domain-containing protein [Stenotrophomonas bentonitica]|uniref:DUF1294 domain-containing protein n=1 Tax=Stenotrophomonas bentonitica TaxID=1450134 RepID=UPI00345E4E0B